MKRGKTEMTPPVSPPSESDISSESEEDAWEREVRMKLMPNVYTVQISSLKTTTVKSGFDAKNV
jgi:hypothetical protein